MSAKKISRATFDTFWHNFDFGFPTDRAALEFITNSYCDYALDNRALHEFTHFLFNGSPVTRAIRALRTKSFIVLCKAIRRANTGREAEIDKTELFQALNRWRVGLAINQYLLPLYEASALLAEFELTPWPYPDVADQLSIQQLFRRQVSRDTQRGSVERAGEHCALGIADPAEAAVLDCISSRLLSDEVVARKLTVLNQPLNYKSPDQCYLVAWLLAKQWQRSISSAINENADPWFCIKYMRSFFFEDWTLVRHILDLHSGAMYDTAAVVVHIHERLSTFSRSFSRETYDTYRQGVRDMHDSSESVHPELLPGLLRDMSDDECANVFSELEYATFEPLLHEQSDEDDKQIEMAFGLLQNKLIHLTFHTGEYEVWTDGTVLWCEADSVRVPFKLLGDVVMPHALCRVVFVLAPSGDIFQTVAYVDEGKAVAYFGDEEPNAGVILAHLFPKQIGQNLLAESIAHQYKKALGPIYAREIDSAVREGVHTAGVIFLDWLTEQGQFTAELLKFAAQRGYPCLDKLPPRQTFNTLFEDYLPHFQQLKQLVRNSLRFGSGYNAGVVARGEARQNLLHPEQFALEFELVTAISVDDEFSLGPIISRKDTKDNGLQPFYFDLELDGSELPRYTF